MQKILMFFFIIGLSIFAYVSYITVIGRSFKNRPAPEPSETERVLAEQRRRSETLNQDYRRIMEENRRTMENNRRAMEELRRQNQR